MRVRIRKHPEYDGWVVETWNWSWPFYWVYVGHKYSKEEALKSALLLKHPEIQEVK